MLGVLHLGKMSIRESDKIYEPVWCYFFHDGSITEKKGVLKASKRSRCEFTSGNKVCKVANEEGLVYADRVWYFERPDGEEVLNVFFNKQHEYIQKLEEEIERHRSYLLGAIQFNWEKD